MNLKIKKPNIYIRGKIGIWLIFSSLQVRGPHLKDTVDVSALKPCVLTLVEGKAYID